MHGNSTHTQRERVVEMQSASVNCDRISMAMCAVIMSKGNDEKKTTENRKELCVRRQMINKKSHFQCDKPRIYKVSL